MIFHSCVSLPEGNGGFKLINQRYSGAATGPARRWASSLKGGCRAEAAKQLSTSNLKRLVAAEAKFENPPPSLICCWNV